MDPPQEDEEEEEEQKRTIMTGLVRRWPNGVVPYTISSSSTNTGECKITLQERYLIRAAMENIQRESDVRFRHATVEDSDWLDIDVTESGCFYSGPGLGFRGPRHGQHRINLEQARCMNKGTIIHEILHALGFIHEHNHPNRDQYVREGTIYFSSVTQCHN